MKQIRIESFTGTTPIDIYVSDFYGNNKYFLGQITGSTPPTIYEYPPSLFDSAPRVMLTLSGVNGCELSKIIDCGFGCSFSISIQPESCVPNINITDL